MAAIVWEIEDVPSSKRMVGYPIPKRASELWEWYRAARIAIPQIPNPLDLGWTISHAVATVDYVIFEMHSRSGERGTIFIDRKLDMVRI